jgi:protoheme IX farnesyltransferase
MSSKEKNSSLNIGSKIKDYLKLIKLSLSIMVVFSSVLAYLLVPGIESKYENPLKMTILLAYRWLISNRKCKCH